MKRPRTPLKRANNQLVSAAFEGNGAVDIGSLWAENFVVWILIRPPDKSRKTNFVPANSRYIYISTFNFTQSFPRPLKISALSRDRSRTAFKQRNNAGFRGVQVFQDQHFKEQFFPDPRPDFRRRAKSIVANGWEEENTRKRIDSILETRKWR